MQESKPKIENYVAKQLSRARFINQPVHLYRNVKKFQVGNYGHGVRGTSIAATGL